MRAPEVRKAEYALEDINFRLRPFDHHWMESRNQALYNAGVGGGLGVGGGGGNRACYQMYAHAIDTAAFIPSVTV